MRLKHVMQITTVAAAAVGASASRTADNVTSPPNTTIAALASPLVSPPNQVDGPLSPVTSGYVENRIAVSFQPPELMSRQRAEQNDLKAVFQALAMPPWEGTIETGDGLDLLLSRAGIDAQVRAEVALAMASEYNLRRLRPGHRLNVNFRPDGTPSVVTLTVNDGVRIEVTLGSTITGKTVTPSASSVERAGQLLVNGSIYASLDGAGVPARFAVDLAQILGDTVDFRKDLQGGENLKILWGQTILPDGSEVGQPQLAYAALDRGDDRFEIVWSQEDRGRANVYLNGEILRTVAPPVEGARLSSAFGQRKHPIYGNMRMHTGVDYAVAAGTPIAATASGRVSFIGWRSGYGRAIDIAHSSDTMTRYAHLSAVTEGLVIGSHVLAGDVIGQVGETGTATAPNLHYEVRIDGRPINPLAMDIPTSVDNLDVTDAMAMLEETRTRFAAALSENI